MEIKINDVRRRSDLADYTGEVLVNQCLRITDRYNGPGRQNEPGTMTEYDFPVRSPCQRDPRPREGRRLLAHDERRLRRPRGDQGGQAHDLAARPGERVRRRAGRRSRHGPNNVFLTQGIFVP